MMRSAMATEYEDRRTIATPEGVELALPLAGVGSRFMALLLDSVLQAIIVGAAAVLGYALLGDLAATIVLSAGLLFAYLVYDVAFEVRGGGRTLGKRAVGLRVVRDGGGPVGLRASLIRNVIRLFEATLLYVPAIVSIIATRTNQRLGDLAAGTLVIRDPRAEQTAPSPAAPVPAESYASWDATGVNDAEVAAVRAFLQRRDELRPAARRTLAAQLATRLRPRVAGVRPGLDDESFLERLAAAKESRDMREIPQSGNDEPDIP
jgi:uncharacterized RDD family membrane protein YckC